MRITGPISINFARFAGQLSNEDYSRVARIALVSDNHGMLTPAVLNDSLAGRL